MSETTTKTSCSTKASAATLMQAVTIATFPEATDTQTDDSVIGGIPVRIQENADSVIVIQFQPKALEEQRKTEEMNERIEKYGKAY